MTGPRVYLIARPSLDWGALEQYLTQFGTPAWPFYQRRVGGEFSDAQTLIEAGGRICYRSWAPGLNANVTKVREDQGEYLRNILASGHGSVLEHASYSFIIDGVSRVFTHELVRHRAGTAISQESQRYVRLDQAEVPFPEDLVDEALSGSRHSIWGLAERIREDSQALQRIVGNVLDESGADFATKKRITSAARRYMPQGVLTCLLWTANVRALRHVIELRTAAGAEAEIRQVFGMVAEIMKQECPVLFGDFVQLEDGTWKPQYSKV